ncbi:MAG: queuosine precursor transporter [Chloroflexota bacterium]|jgi:uncharacterized integral membrane protein (TIGR00697 family)
MRFYKYLDLITAAFVAVLIISNIASTKIVSISALTFDGGTVLFPLAYIFGDVLTEVYGYKRSRRVIWTGFFWIIIASCIFSLIDWLPAAPGYELSKSFHSILGQEPRIVSASILGAFSGEFTNSFILAKMKLLTRGKWLWTRTIGSTIAGEAVDTVVFTLIAFLGVLPSDLLLTVIVSNYVFKVGVEVLFTPLTYRVVSFLKRTENEDYYDWNTDFNPMRTDV